jgi:putative tricarboxylic transport membrane protein
MTTAVSARADRVSATLLLLFSVLVIFEARALPYWTANAPGPGFVPFWLGVMLAGASVALLVRTIRVGGAKAPPYTAESQTLPDRATTFRVATVVTLTAGAAALSLVAGLVVASGVFMGVTLAYLRRGHPRGNFVAAILTPIVVWLLFVRWLGVPLPAGLFGY